MDPSFARLYDAVMGPAERLLQPHRRALVAGLSGTVLDVGAGTGATFPYFAEVGSDLTVHAVEPDSEMRRRAARRRRSLDLDVSIVGGVAEALPYRDDCADGAVTALVLCTVDDPDAALDEIARVVRPGGELRILEHVRGDGAGALARDAAAPVWEAIAGGCRLNRPTDERLREDDRFETVELGEVETAVPLPTPIVRGRFRVR